MIALTVGVSMSVMRGDRFSLGRVREGFKRRAKSGWAISVPDESNIIVVPCRPGRVRLTNSLYVSSLRSMATTPFALPRNGALNVIIGVPRLKDRYGADTTGR